MRNKLALFVLLNLTSFLWAYTELSSENDEWIKILNEKEQAIIFANQEAKETIESFEKNKIRKEDVEWLKGQLKENISKPVDVSFLQSDSSSKCKNCFTGDLLKILEEPDFKIFISFSVPESIWCSLSKDLVKVGGTFILIGLPNNSFPELSEKILKLKQMGVEAQIQIDPVAFKKYDVSQVPTFVISDGDKYDKVSGCISTEYALNYLSEKGELQFSKLLKKKLGDF